MVEKVKGTENPSDLMTKHLDGQNMDRMLKLLGVEAREGRAASAPKVIVGDDENGQQDKKMGQGKRGVQGQVEKEQQVAVDAPPKEWGECEGRSSASKAKDKKINWADELDKEEEKGSRRDWGGRPRY